MKSPHIACRGRFEPLTRMGTGVLEVEPPRVDITAARGTFPRRLKLSCLAAAVVALTGCRLPPKAALDRRIVQQYPLPAAPVELPAGQSPFEDVTDGLGISIGGCVA